MPEPIPLADPAGSADAVAGPRCAARWPAPPTRRSSRSCWGAVPDDHDLYLAGFGGDDHQSLRLMLSRATDVAGMAKMALAAPISQNDTEGVRLLLEAGADPRRYADDDGAPASAACEAAAARCS